MASKDTTETSHANGSRPPSPRAARATKRKAVAKATRTARRAQAERAPRIGHIVTTGAFVILGAVFVLGAAAFAALLAGYEPPGYEAKARRLRRYTLAHTPDLPKAADVWEPVGKQLGRSERWMREKIHNATR
jgi:hypothetical protein